MKVRLRIFYFVYPVGLKHFDNNGKIFKTNIISISIYTHAEKRPPRTLYKVLLICIIIPGSLIGQRYIDEVHPHVLQIYQTV